MLPYAAFVSLAIRGRFCFLILKCFYNQLLTGPLRREMRRIPGAATFVPMKKKKIPFVLFYYCVKYFTTHLFLH